MGTLTANTISTTYKNLLFQKADNKLYYTNASDVDTEITTLASPMAFTGKITATAGIELDNNIIYASDGGTTITLDTSDNVAITGDLIVTGNDIKSGNIGSSTTAITLSSANVAIAGDLTVTGNDIKSNGGTTALTLSSDDVTVVGDLTVTGTSSGKLTLGSDADGTDRTIVFGHSTLKTVMGIDDDQDVFAINTDAAFESANDLEIDASGNVTIPTGELRITKIAYTDGDDALTINDGGSLTSAGNLTLGGHLLFGGSSPYLQFLDAQGFILKSESATYITASSSSIAITKGVSISNTLTATGTASFTGNKGTDPGTGITGGTGTICKNMVERNGDIIKTTIIVDVTGLRHSAAADIIGVDGTSNPCYLTRVVTGTNGAIFSGRMTCLEQPTVQDMDLYGASESTGVEDGAISSLTEKQIINGGTQSAGTVTLFDNANLPAANDYLYFVCQSAGDADYSAGKFLIEMWGTAS